MKTIPVVVTFGSEISRVISSTVQFASHQLVQVQKDPLVYLSIGLPILIFGLAIVAGIKSARRRRVLRHASYLQPDKESDGQFRAWRLPKKARDGFHSSRAWLDLRYRVLARYGRRCQLCGSVEHGKIQVDHIKPRSIYPHLALDINNLQVLCRDCNRGKSNRYVGDFRNR